MPWARASAPMAATGCTVPISLLACMIEMPMVSGRMACLTSSGSIMPCPSTPT